MRKVRVDCGCAGLARKLCQVLVQYDVEEAAMRIPIKASKMRARTGVQSTVVLDTARKVSRCAWIIHDP